MRRARSTARFVRDRCFPWRSTSLTGDPSRPGQTFGSCFGSTPSLRIPLLRSLASSPVRSRA